MTSRERSEQLIARLKRYKPRDDDELHEWIYIVLGVSIPRVSVCENHCAPFEFLADSFFDRSPRAICMANRAGGKTLMAAILHYLELLFKPGIELASVGAIFTQAAKCYRYVQQFSRGDYEGGLIEHSTRQVTTATNGSRLEILTGKTVEAVNSPHPEKATIDEFDLMAEEVIQEAYMMPVESKHHVSGIRLLSTRKKMDGPMQEALDHADERDFVVYQYCALECGQTCTFEDRPSCGPCQEIIKFDHQNEPVSFYDVCQERLRNAQGYIPVDKLIGDFKLLDVEKYLTQMAPCQKPARGDTVFSEFSDELHVVKDLAYNPELPIGTGWDFGINDPMVCIVFQWDGDSTVYAIEEIGSGPLAKRPEHRQRLVSDVTREVLARPYGPRLKRSRDNWCDPAGRQRNTYTRVDSKSAVDVMRSMGLPVRYKKNPNPARRIAAIKLKLRRGASGPPRIFISSRCPVLIRALNYAQWEEGKENYEHEPHSHPLDALGYFIDAKWPERQGDTPGAKLYS